MNYKTEYTRRYKNFDYLPASSEDLTTATDMHVRRRRRRRRPTDSENLVGSNESLMDYTSEQQDKFIPLGGAPPAQIIRRSSSLQREGEFMVTSSEMQSKFKRYEDAHRAELSRRPTSLRMEGNMDTTTETAEKFIDMLIHERPHFAKMASNLQMEGEMESVTEKGDKYKKFDVQRNIVAKQPANLQLEGKMVVQSEKQEKYIPFNLEQRPILVKRGTNLKLEGDMFTDTESREKYIPFGAQRQPLMKRSTNLHMDGDMDTRTESNVQFVPREGKRPPLAKRDTNLQLEGELNLSPEYRAAYIEYPAGRKISTRPINQLGSGYNSDRDESPEKMFRSEGKQEMIPLYKENYKPHTVEKFVTKRPKENLRSEGVMGMTTESGEIGRAIMKGTKVDTEGERAKAGVSGEITQEMRQKRAREQPSVRSEGRIESNPEYRSSHLGPRERPVVRKTTTSPRRADGTMAHLLEKEAKQVQAGAAKPEEEGRFECQPEYRKAYNAYLQRENIRRIPRPFDKLELKEEAGTSVVAETPTSTTKSRYSIPSRQTKIRDRTVPRTPRQEKVLVPDLSGNAVRRASSIFGPKPLRKALSRPTSPVGGYKYVLPESYSDICDPREKGYRQPESPCRKGTSPCRKEPRQESSCREGQRQASPCRKVCSRQASPCRKVCSRPASPCRKVCTRQPSPCRKPPCPTKVCREREVPSSPCDRHRSPSGRPCMRKHSPCARLASRPSSPCHRPPSPCEKSYKQPEKERPSSLEPIPILLYPPSPTVKRAVSPRPKQVSSSEEEYKSSRQVKVSSPRRKKASRDERTDLASSFVVLQDAEVNNNNVKRRDGKEQRWMPAWYEQPKK